GRSFVRGVVGADRVSGLQQSLNRWESLDIVVFPAAPRRRRDDQHPRQEQLRLHRFQLAHSDHWQVLLRGRIRRRRQQRPELAGAWARRYGLRADLPGIWRLWISVFRELGRHRKPWALLPCYVLIP